MNQAEKGAVVITGTSSGIGQACALFLDRRGYLVFAGVRTAEDGERMRTRASVRLVPVVLDVTDSEQISSACNTIKKALGPMKGLTGLVNNAGITLPGSVEFMSLEALRHVLEVNVVGQIAVTQAFLPLIREGRGRIINIGSVLGRFVMPLSGAYAASKYAIKALTDSLRRELRPWGICVVLVEPGSVQSAIWAKIEGQEQILKTQQPHQAKELYADTASAMTRLWEKAHRSACSPEKVAKVVARALEARRPNTCYLVGADARLVAFMANFFSERLADWVICRLLATL